ncbi:MAG: hypothetical protein ACTSRE_04870 [Promethearchaeota archaeon]
MTLTEKEVNSLVKWDSWKTVFVKSKEDHMKVRTGTPQKTFWDIWEDRKEEIKELSIYVKRVEGNNEVEIPPQWIVNQWKEASDNEKNLAKQDWDKKQNSPTTV